jgi:hypothetical protein
MKPKDIIKETLTSLEKEELRLFHSYNRHATTECKLGVLTKLVEVINKIDVLRTVNK